MITGARGFLGRNLAAALDEHELILVDKDPTFFEDTESVRWGFRHVHTCDLLEDIHILKQLMYGVDVVLHLAAATRIPRSWSAYKEYYETNISASQQLLQLAQTTHVKKFIHFSSSSVYGNNGTDTQTEDSPLCPTNPYAVSKVASEMALRVQAEGGKTELVIVRPFTMYGDYMDWSEDALVIAKFLTALKEDEPLMLHGNGTPTRDFLHSSDAVMGIKLIIEHSKDGDIYNLGTGRSVSVKQLADCVSDRQVLAPNRRGAVERTCADTSKLRALGFNPQIDVLDWLTDKANDLKIKSLKQVEVV